MKTYKAVRAEIAKLEQQAEALRARELKSVIAELKLTIAEYGLTASDLGLGERATAAAVRRRAPAKVASRGVKSPGQPRYRDPKTGKTWTGRGKPPAWIAAAKNRDAYLIAEPVAPSPKAARARPAGKAGAAVKRGKAARSAPAKKASAAKRKKARRPVRTPAVQIESGVASE